MARKMEMDMLDMEGMSPEKMEGEAALMVAVQGVEDAEQEYYNEAAPMGDFSKSALNSLVAAHNRLLPMFGIEEEYPQFAKDETQFPEEFVKQLMMVQAAVGDAVAGDIVDAEMEFELGDAVKDDRDVSMLAGKLKMLANSRDFRQFLKEGVGEEEDEGMAEMGEMETEETEGEMSEEEMDELMMARM
jgi:hypothetical protein